MSEISETSEYHDDPEDLQLTNDHDTVPKRTPEVQIFGTTGYVDTSNIGSRRTWKGDQEDTEETHAASTSETAQLPQPPVQSNQDPTAKEAGEPVVNSEIAVTDGIPTEHVEGVQTGVIIEAKKPPEIPDQLIESTGEEARTIVRKYVAEADKLSQDVDGADNMPAIGVEPVNDANINPAVDKNTTAADKVLNPTAVVEPRLGRVVLDGSEIKKPYVNDAAAKTPEETTESPVVEDNPVAPESPESATNQKVGAAVIDIADVGTENSTDAAAYTYAEPVEKKIDQDQAGAAPSPTTPTVPTSETPQIDYIGAAPDDTISPPTETVESATNTNETNGSAETNQFKEFSGSQRPRRRKFTVKHVNRKPSAAEQTPLPRYREYKVGKIRKTDFSPKTLFGSLAAIVGGLPRIVGKATFGTKIDDSQVETIGKFKKVYRIRVQGTEVIGKNLDGSPIYKGRTVIVRTSFPFMKKAYARLKYARMTS